MHWVAIDFILVAQLKEGVMLPAQVQGHEIVLTKRGDTIYAFAAKCPHAGALLCDGFIDNRGNVVCPLHGYRYDVRNGYNKSGEGYKLKTYLVKTVGQQIFISLQS